MSDIDNPDSPDYNDTNLGVGSVYDTPEEKEIERLRKQLAAANAKVEKLKELLLGSRHWLNINDVNQWVKNVKTRINEIEQENLISKSNTK